MEEGNAQSVFIRGQTQMTGTSSPPPKIGTTLPSGNIQISSDAFSNTPGKLGMVSKIFKLTSWLKNSKGPRISYDDSL